MKISIDCYGNDPARNPQGYLSPMGRKLPCLVDSSAKGLTYLCFRDIPGPQPIHRVTVAGGITEILWAYGKWEDRATLVYDTEPSRPMIVEV